MEGLDKVAPKGMIVDGEVLPTTKVAPTKEPGSFVMKRTCLTKLAGVALAALASSPAIAQLTPALEDASATGGAQPARTGPTHVLQRNNLDEYGRPQAVSIDELLALPRGPGPQGVQQLIRDDQNFCSVLIMTTEQEARVRAAEQELRAAEEELARANTDQQRRVAERRRNRARLNLIDILLGVGSIVAAPFTGGASLAYTGILIGNQVQSQIRNHNANADSRLWYDQMELYGRQLGLFDERLRLYDLRLQLASVRGEFWDRTMLRYCNEHVRPHMAAVSFGSGPAMTTSPGIFQGSIAPPQGIPVRYGSRALDVATTKSGGK